MARSLAHSLSTLVYWIMYQACEVYVSEKQNESEKEPHTIKNIHSFIYVVIANLRYVEKSREIR